MSRWMEDTTYKFVAEYLKHDCLWNIHASSYKMKHKRHEAHLALQKAMNLPGFGIREIYQKIKNIRSTYSQERKKIKLSVESGASVENIYVPRLKWYQMLDSKLRSATCAGTYHTDMETNEDQDPLEDPLESAQNDPAPTTEPTKRKRQAELSSVLDKIKNLTETAVSLVEEAEDEFDAFGRLVAAQLRSLPLPLALEAQQHIHTYINQCRMSQLPNQHYQLNANAIANCSYDAYSSNSTPTYAIDLVSNSLGSDNEDDDVKLILE